MWRGFIDGYAGPAQTCNLPDFATLPYFVFQAEHKSLMFLYKYISLSDNALNTVKRRMQDLIRLWSGFDGKDHYIFPSKQGASDSV
ncbi:hypothetical protein Brsp01_27980 [Brucella sp. NBRC 12950]|nr:hypothetical protein Brsp01_27980 [Brucella sp. NBRC 12950]